VVEVDEEGPVHKPCPGVELHESRLGSIGGGGRGGRCEECAGGARVDSFAEGIQLFKCDVPPTGKDVGGELAPVSGSVEVVIGGEDAEVV
jgi:hypothetical protein